MLATHPDGHVAVAQPAHAWLSGQLACAWGNGRFGALKPRPAVCLAAAQHDIGMAEWDLAPTLDSHTGLPTIFTGVDLATHMRLWTEGPARLVVQSRYAALLASLHGSALYESRAGDPQVARFLERQGAFQARLRATLDAPDDQVTRNQRLLRTWDGLSLALILEWDPWTSEDVPTADGDMANLLLSRGEHVHTLAPWPFAGERVVVGTEGRLLRRRFSDQDRLHEALADAPWVDLRYELRPA